LAGLELIQENASLIEKLWANIFYLKRRLSEYTVTIPVESPIIPLIVGSAKDALALSHELYRNGILIPAIRPPTVPKGTSRLRISLMATHSDDDINTLIDTLKITGFLSHKNRGNGNNDEPSPDMG
jgi:7-keto-8-aminopelargonate synthetase-like enzyme